MSDLLFNPDLTDERLERAAHVYAVTGPGLFIIALIEELRQLRQAYAERADERDEAREGARIIYGGKCADPREWVERWPWLEETES